jgi:predicted aspartyl protease
MIDDMGIFRIDVLVENPERPGQLRAVGRAMVDTGSEYTWIPRADLEALGLVARRTAAFVSADGREIVRDVCYGNLYVSGTSAPDILVFAEPGDFTLLGARALEGLNLRVDVATKQLVPAGPVPAAVAA